MDQPLNARKVCIRWLTKANAASDWKGLLPFGRKWFIKS